MAAGDIQLEREVVKARLETLVRLQEYVTMLRGSLQDLHARQTTGTWSTAGHTQSFVSAYRAQLTSLDTELKLIHRQMADYHAALQSNMSNLVSTDEDVQARLMQVAQRLNASPNGATAPPGTPGAPGSAPVAPTSTAPREHGVG